eukprot:scaffold134071_cov20-Tisochrysis_lutea.AAC.3
MHKGAASAQKKEQGRRAFEHTCMSVQQSAGCMPRVQAGKPKCAKTYKLCMRTCLALMDTLRIDTNVPPPCNVKIHKQRRFTFKSPLLQRFPFPHYSTSAYPHRRGQRAHTCRAAATSSLVASRVRAPSRSVRYTPGTYGRACGPEPPAVTAAAVAAGAG